MQGNDSAIFSEIDIELKSLTPKYLQIKNAIVEAVNQNRIKPYDRLPSINQMSYHLDISRDTVERGYRHLKEIGVLASVPCKGFYIQLPEQVIEKRIFVLINELNEQLTDFYKAFLNEIGQQAIADLYVYNNDANDFLRLLEKRRDDYTHFVIIPPDSLDKEVLEDLLFNMPSEKLVVISGQIPDQVEPCGKVNFNFEENIFSILHEQSEKLQRYQVMKLVCGNPAAFQARLISCFQRYARSLGLKVIVINSVQDLDIRKGDLIIQMSSEDLIPLAEKIMNSGFSVGKEVGIISLQKSAISRVLFDGIFAIYIDYAMVGKKTADLISKPRDRQIDITFSVDQSSSI